MDLSTLIAAAPVIKRAWKYTPTPLRVPLLVAGAVIIAWRLFADGDEDSSDAAGGPGPTST